MTLVFNASPLIVLAKASLLDRLLPLGDKVWIPGLILMAKQAGLIPSASRALDAIVRLKVYLSHLIIS